MFHIGWFVPGGGVQGWGSKWVGSIGATWTQPDLYVDMCRALESACFDYVIIEDSLMIADTFRGTMEHSLSRAFTAPKNDPLPMLPLLTQATSHIGVIGTITSTFYPPFTAARLGTTLDHLTRGRVGLNVVTASSHRSAQNYGLEKHVEHDERYAMADEWMDVCNALWDSWEPGAVVADEEQGVYADYTKVHPINFKGKYFACRGPLNTIPGPQRRPVICQAGGSPAGRAFAARHADTILSSVNDVPHMKEYRDNISALMKGHGRNPKDCKVLFFARPILAETDAEAKAIHERRCAAEEARFEDQLALMSYFSGVDMAQFNPDEPMPDLTGKVNGHQSTMVEYARTPGETLREMALNRRGTRLNPFVGSPDTVSAIMGEIMQEVGGDGFLIAQPVSRRTVAEIADGLAPALRRRGLIRKGYPHKTFRENLLDF
jgi:FMN-dependent oxidoreductase (nitrilotriacetate monooxygenase family)